MATQQELRKMYRAMERDIFGSKMTITITDCMKDENGNPIEVPRTVHYEKVTWKIGDEVKGLRYGDNPGQSCALFKPVNGNFVFGEVETIVPGKYLLSDAELLQSGKHPGKTNITDVDNALNILKNMMDMPTVAIMKHNNPSGVASRDSIENAYLEADAADRVAAFGGAIVLNRAVDKATAEAIASRYSEVVAAPEFEEGALGILTTKKDLRIMRIKNISRLQEWQDEVFLNFKSQSDGSIIVETCYIPKAKTVDDLKALGIPTNIEELVLNEETRKMVPTGRKASIERTPTEAEYRDMLFGWLVEAGVSSNSVIYVKNLATVGIGTGEQDRVGVADIAKYKAYTKLADRICFEKHKMAFNDLLKMHERAAGSEKEKYGWVLSEQEKCAGMIREINEEINSKKGGLQGAVIVSDAFFPDDDGARVGLREGATAIIQPGGSNADYKTIVACNEHKATMVYTGQRSFKH